MAAWRLRGAYPTDETYLVSGGATRPRIALSLGEPLPVLSEYSTPSPSSPKSSLASWLDDLWERVDIHLNQGCRRRSTDA
jgi:hypothetical protein